MTKIITRRSVAVVTAMALGISLLTVGTSSAVDATWNCKPSKSKPVTVRLIEYFAGPARTPLLNAYARQYESMNPGVKVEIISPSQADAPAKITQLLQAKNVDIVESAGAILGQAMSAKQPRCSGHSPLRHRPGGSAAGKAEENNLAPSQNRWLPDGHKGQIRRRGDEVSS